MARKKSTVAGTEVADVTADDKAIPMSEAFNSINQAQGHTAAIQYLKDMGVTWKECEHNGINWMRACMAANKAAM